MQGTMSKIDVQWGPPVDVRERRWGWRHEITAQVVNPDIDGLLTACLLYQLKGWPIIGFYDTKRLMLDCAVQLPLELRTVAWVDVDMCWPGARSVSQHVVLDDPDDAQQVSAFAETVNPSLLRGHPRKGNYRDKYPFGTFQWAWWLAKHPRLAAPDPEDALMTGLAWMPDGGFQSVEGVWRANCIRWATQHLPGSILEPLARTDPGRARAAVAVAEDELIRRSGVDRGWHNYQFNLTRGSSKGPRLNFREDEISDVIEAICNSIAEIYGWRPPQVPRRLTVLNGVWRTAARPPAGWPEASQRLEVVSLAVTRGDQLCWTEPGELAAALPCPG
jgi:hypothetical protein